MNRKALHPHTELVNKNQKNQSKQARTKALAWLRVRFPAAFDSSESIFPLQIGIATEIFMDHYEEAAREGISRSKLRQALALFTLNLDYLTCLKAGEPRIDLQGNPVGVVTEDEADQALTKRKNQIERRKKQQQKSVKSARNAPEKLIHPGNPVHHYKASRVQPGSSASPAFPSYPTRSASVNTTTPKASSTTITHKTSRQYDPHAVARLKEKLDLSRAEEKEKSI